MLYNDWKAFHEPSKLKDFKNEARKAFEDRYLAPEALTLGSFDPGSWRLDEPPKSLSARYVDGATHQSALAAKDKTIEFVTAALEAANAEVAALKEEVESLRAINLALAAPENPKLAAGEALANAFRADSFSSPYGR